MSAVRFKRCIFGSKWPRSLFSHQRLNDAQIAFLQLRNLRDSRRRTHSCFKSTHSLALHINEIPKRIESKEEIKREYF